MGQYHPEPYWSEVARRIKSRKGQNVIAGDDEPYYRYKRRRFLSLLGEVDFQGKKVLEIGSGPGGNLREIWASKPLRLTGADISAEMVELAKSHLPGEVEVVKVDGTTLPFQNNEFDCVFSATVLQHNTDDQMMRLILGEMCRVSNDKVYLFERIEKEITGDDLCSGRPVAYYASICRDHGFELASKKFINIKVSYLVSGAIRKGLNSKSRREGEPLNGVSNFLQNITLPVTSLLDKVFSSATDVARLEFKRVF